MNIKTKIRLAVILSAILLVSGCAAACGPPFVEHTPDWHFEFSFPYWGFPAGLFSLALYLLPTLIAAIRRLFAGIPWRNFTGNDLAEAEGYYASVLYAFLASLDAQVIPEDISNHGQVDLTVRIAGYTYVMEIKLRRDALPAGPADPAGANPALAQIQARGYSAKYRGAPGKGLFEVGLVFGRAERNLVQADWRAVGA